jgi:uncharacterized protein
MIGDLTPVLNPTTSKERIEMIDSLRGFALTGVCLGNLALFSLYNCMGNVQKADLPFPVFNTVISYLIYFFVDWKFWTLFSLMFGFGAYMFISRTDELHKNGRALYATRLLILLIFGLIHGTFFWYGDILSEYALAGFILLLFSNKKGVSLAFWGIMLGAVVPPVVKILQFKLLPGTSEVFDKLNILTLDAYSSNSYSKVINANLVINKIFSLYMWYHLIAALGRFLIGFWIGQSGRVHLLEKNSAIFEKAMRICAWIGFPAMLITTTIRILIDTQVLSPKSEWESATCLLSIASLAIGMFYAIKFALLYQNEKWRKRLSIFKEMGRMALTNYLMQTIINVLIFNGIGFGLAGKIGPSIYVLWFFILVILQIIFSKWWLLKHQFGPFEWLWRSFIYKKLRPMKAEG